MDAHRPYLTMICFAHTFDGDLLTFTCILCSKGFVYTLHAPEHVVTHDLLEHLRSEHKATQAAHAWEET